MKLKILKFNLIVFISFFMMLSCNQDLSEQSKKEILEVERQFDSITQIKGIKEAFFQFADSQSVFNRNEKLVLGADEILKYYSNPKYEKVSLSWKPDFVGASRSGEIGYTYGKYTYKIKDSLGTIKELNGIFHTVWKKNKSGEWKIAWD